MKTLNVYFTDAEFKKLVKAKNKTTYSNWNKFIMQLTKGVSCFHTKKKPYTIEDYYKEFGKK